MTKTPSVTYSKTDPNWQEYFVSLLRDDEKRDGYPTCAGIRRVCEDVYGKIGTCDSELLSFVNGIAVVKVTIVCNEYMPADDDGIIHLGREIVQSAIADCSEANTPAPFCNHPTSTAETKAEGRALRKLLCLNFYTAEEMTTATPQELAKDIQVRMIKSSLEERKIDVNKFMAKYAGLTEKHLNTKIMSRSIADKLLNQINEFNNGEEVPAEIAV